MLRKNRLFTPGPTPILPAAQTAMASFAVHHRTADFRALFQRVLADMKDFIGTQNDVLVLASSGTGVMEGAVSNLTSPGDRVLVLTAGKFGERWRDLANAFGCNVELVSAPYGQTFSLDEIRHKLTADVRAVYVQATESSTGARHDVEGIAKLVRATDDTLLVVDAITGLGTTRLDVDGWGIDVIIGGSQKELGLKLFAPSCPAAALTAIQSPAGIDSGAIVKEFRETFSAVVANGQGEMKGKLFRIAHIGYYDYLDTIGILAALEHVLGSVTGNSVEYGAGVRAAQHVYARAAEQQSVGAR